MQSIFRIALAFVFLSCVSAVAADDSLRDGFANPPMSAHPQTWWHWMNGNVTKEGITADLEAMHRVGIAEANIITVYSDIPAGPVPVMSPAFFDMVEHATKEADRLGMTLCMDNCPGWSSSGGPWVTPEHAMQFVTFSETKVAGPVHFSAVLPQPKTKKDFYRDITVLAFHTPVDEAPVDLVKLAAKISASVPGVDAGPLIQADAKAVVTLPMPEKDKPQSILLEFEKPVTARTLLLTPGPRCIECGGNVEFSDDGQKYSAGKSFNIPRSSRAQLTIDLGDDLVTAKFFRINFTTGRARENQSLAISKVGLTRRLMIEKLQNKAVYASEAVASATITSETKLNASSDQVVHRDGIIDLSSSMQPDGTLSYDFPAGDWTIVRFGYTPTGVTNHPAPPEATGLECDKLSRDGLDASWNGMMQPILDKLGPLGGKVMQDCLIDSYETGGQNWTAKMAEEFMKHRGYDPRPYLITLTGRVVDSPEISERFLWDLRRTVADLFAENYWDYFTELCHKHGMKALTEPYYGPFEGMQSGRSADVPMGEFWSGSDGHSSLKLASSIGHTNGQPVIGAESFTGGPEHGRWTDDPYSLKALGDLAFCQGINRYIFHRYTHQPWMNRFPGMTMGQWGINLERTNTWFEKSKPWMDYISRSQFVLQQGKFVADIACFDGDSTPGIVQAASGVVPRGYDYDMIDSGVLKKCTVSNHRLILPDGMSYALLVLPESDPQMTPATLDTIAAMVRSGLTVVGPRPTRSPSLSGYPNCDRSVTSVADEVWGDCDGKQVTEHAYHDGKVIWGKPMDQVLAEMKLPADFSNEDDGSPCMYIHRRTEDTDIYFVSNREESYRSIACTFRITGKVPELWHPDTGEIETAAVWSEKDGVTTVTIPFDPVGSVFVIFKRSSAGVDHLVDVRQSQPTNPAVGITITRASYEAVDGSGGLDVMQLLSRLAHRGSIDLQVNNRTMGSDPTPDHVKHLKLSAMVNGKAQDLTVEENSRLHLSAFGTVEEAPYRLRVAGDGTVEAFCALPGDLEFHDAAGKLLKLTAASAASRNEVAGPWDLNFPPNWGAPASVHLEKLISWPDHPDAGVKYFSGTATYQKQLDIPADSIANGRSILLDLGMVKNIAQVSINGKDLGILWKPPFRLDITSAVTAGSNKLEVQVTNLWPNRIIGDAQLAEDTQWSGMKPAGWPQWLLDGKPSPTGRYTFYTWRHWTKDATLLESGLIGPVVIESGVWMKPQ